MSEELGRAAHELIEAGREGVPPDELTAERIRRAVDCTLQGSAAPARTRNRVGPMLVALGAAALAGAIYAASSLSDTELPRSPAMAPAAPKPSPARVVRPAPTVAPPVAAPDSSSRGTPVAPAPVLEAVRAPAGSRTSRAPASRSQTLAAEIALLARVNAAVNAGNGAKALELLAEYDREFRPGMLGEERAAASILALCAAGRTGEARAAAQRFHARWQRSAHAPRLAKSCAGTR